MPFCETIDQFHEKTYKISLFFIYSALKASIVTVRHFNLFHADEGLTENDILAVDETELEEMKEFSTREFMNLRPASEVELNSNNMTDDQDMQDQDQSGAII